MKAIKLDHYSVKLVEITGETVADQRRAMRDEIGGRIATVLCGMGRFVMIADDDSIVKGLPQNALASLVAEQQIYGPALVVGLRADADGEIAFGDCPENVASNLLLLGT